MPFICRCGNKEFERAAEPLKEALQRGVTPLAVEPFLRCTNQACKRPIAEALELQYKCPDCGRDSFKHIGFGEVADVINGRILSPHSQIMMVECTGCHQVFGQDQLEELAELCAYRDGFVLENSESHL